MACFPAIVKNNVIVAKICKYALSESSEWLCYGPRKPANPCHTAPSQIQNVHTPNTKYIPQTKNTQTWISNTLSQIRFLKYQLHTQKKHPQIENLRTENIQLQEARYFAGQDRPPEAHPWQQAQGKGVTRKRRASLNVFSWFLPLLNKGSKQICIPDDNEWMDDNLEVVLREAVNKKKTEFCE